MESMLLLEIFGIVCLFVCGGSLTSGQLFMGYFQTEIFGKIE